MKLRKKWIYLGIAAIVCVGLVIVFQTESDSKYQIPYEYLELNEPRIKDKYSTFLNDNEKITNAVNYSTPFLPEDFILQDHETLGIHEGLKMYRLNENKKIKINFDAPEKAFYIIKLNYFSFSDAYNDNQISLMINNEFQYSEATTITLEERWVSASMENNKDRFGNDILPQQSKTHDLMTFYLKDSTRLHNEPLKFIFDEGLNVIDIECLAGDFYLIQITIEGVQVYPDYQEYLQGYQLVEIQPLRYEGEKFKYKNQSSIQPYSSKDPGIKPFDLTRSRLNIIDYDEPGNKVTWQVEVDKAGLYFLTLKAMQDSKYTTSYRTLYINGEIPFDEAKLIPFRYSKNWKGATIGSLDGTPYAIYLPEGISELSLEVNASLMRIVSEKLSQMSMDMTDLGLAIKSATANSTDTSIDWEIRDYFEDIDNVFATWINEIEEIIKYIKGVNGYSKEGWLINDLKNALSNLKTLNKNLNKLPTRLSLLSEGSSCAAQFIAQDSIYSTYTALSIDALYLSSDSSYAVSHSNYFESAWVDIKRFFNSFVDENYSDKATDDEITVWVYRARPYVDLIQKMADESFTKETGFKAKVILLKDEAKIVLANSAGRQPDAALGISSWIPNEFGMRGAIQDLRQFPDYIDVLDNYNNEQFVPLIYNNQLFGIPDTENFYVLFYRKDILNKLGLNVPDTWDDVINLLPTLQGAGMNFYIPLSNTTSAKSYDMTAPFLYQNEGKLYSDDSMHVGLEDANSLAGLRFMSDLYKEYSLPLQVGSFFNEFRYGYLPIGIADFGTYLSLLNAAHEISGLWDISVVPGTTVNTGTETRINRYMPGAQQSCMIFNKSDKLDEAWEFVKWWTKTETQLQFSDNMVNTYGRRYIWNTANINAFKQNGWNKNHKAIITEQWKWLKEVPKIPGSYVIEREISNIWNSVVFEDSNLRDTVNNAVLRMNKEILRKMVEFGYMDKNGNILKAYSLPSGATVEDWRRRNG